MRHDRLNIELIYRLKKRGVKKKGLKRVKKRSTKMATGLKVKSYEDLLKELGIISLTKKFHAISVPI